jgi:hypothetical protein
MTGLTPHAELKFIIYALSKDNTEIVVEKTSESSNYDDFVAELPPSDCRYAVYDFEYEKGDEGKRNKLCFYAWCTFSPFLPLEICPLTRNDFKVARRSQGEVKDALRFI